MKPIALAVLFALPVPAFAMGAAPSQFTLSPVDVPKGKVPAGCRVVAIAGKDHLSCKKAAKGD